MTLKITGVNVHFVDKYLYAEVLTDAGIAGVGETGAWGYLEPTAVAIEKFVTAMPLEVWRVSASLPRWPISMTLLRLLDT